MTPTKHALLSVHDKTGLVELGRGLAERGFALVASGGTAKRLIEAGLTVRAVEDLTGFPEVLGGRVKTLHPHVHAGILARRTPEHLAELGGHGIAAIDLVVCNLYPFQATVARAGVTEAEAIEEIDIGGVTLLRAAAKNFESVAVVCDPSDYGAVLEALDGGFDLDLRRSLALKAFRHTATYDAAIATWLGGRVEGDEALPKAIHLSAERIEVLRYGENPHQQAALYRLAGADPAFEQLQGKELSYNNLVDLEAAWAMPWDFSDPAVAIIKHTNPCGLAVGATASEAFRKALESDPVSAFGSIITVNRTIDADFVQSLGKLFVEVLAAPAFTDEALELLGRRKKACRVMRATGTAASPLVLRNAVGGLLVQTADDARTEPESWKTVTARAPSAEELAELAFAWTVVKHVKSNAIVFTRDGATVGVGAGQMNRVDSVRLASHAAGDRARGAVCASDAFFPFADGIEAAATAGVTAIAQPGGSIRDEEAIEAADRLGLAMVFTGRRHFRH